MNDQVYGLIEDTCWAQLESDPTFKEALAKHNHEVTKLTGKVSHSTIINLETAFFVGGHIFGRAMFELGLQLGRDPNSIFSLPETDGAGHLEDEGAIDGECQVTS